MESGELGFLTGRGVGGRDDAGALIGIVRSMSKLFCGDSTIRPLAVCRRSRMVGTGAGVGADGVIWSAGESIDVGELPAVVDALLLCVPSSLSITISLDDWWWTLVKGQNALRTSQTPRPLHIWSRERGERETDKQCISSACREHGPFQTCFSVVHLLTSVTLEAVSCGSCVPETLSSSRSCCEKVHGPICSCFIKQRNQYCDMS